MSMPMPSMAQVPLSRQSQEAARYLGLSPAQHQALVGVQRDWAAFEQAQSARAAATRSSETLGRLCAESREQQLKARRDAQALLSADQRHALVRLEEALSLMPAVVSAQSAGLLAPSASAAVGGLPEGSIEVDQVFQRVQAKPLPGCQNSLRVYPGTRPTGESPAPSRRGP